MIPQDTTSITPLSLIFTVVLGLTIFIVPRKYALLPLIIAASYITLGQRIVIASFDFTMMRVLILFGWTRILLRHEFYLSRLTIVDKFLILWTTSRVITFTLLHQTTGAFIYRMGHAYDAIGLYFLCRFMIKDLNEFILLLRYIAIIIFPLAIAMIYEKLTGISPFVIFGGVPELSESRLGHIRCQGPFRHPILAGTFGATLMPLMVSLWWQNERTKLMAAIGVIATTVITVTSASSGPLLAYVSGIVGLCMWPFRKNMRIVRWAIVTGILLLAIIMNAPVYFLLARLGDLFGGGGYHRSDLIHQAITHFGEWCFIGVKSTAHWMPFFLTVDPNSADITNQYIAEGVNGGLITMILFFILIVTAFKILGRKLSLIETKPFYIKITAWAMGASLLAHVISFLSVTYFDQIIVSWYLLLAAISSKVYSSILLNFRIRNIIDAKCKSDIELLANPIRT